MIIEEIDSQKQIEIEKEELKQILKLNLPKGYRINWNFNHHQIEGRNTFFFWQEIAWLFKNEDYIVVEFKYKEDFEELRKCFEESPTKFKIKFEEEY